MMRRASFSIVLVGALILMPWWVFFALIVVGGLVFDHYYEAIVFGALFDVWYGLGGFQVLGTLIGLMVYIVLGTVRSRFVSI